MIEKVKWLLVGLLILSFAHAHLADGTTFEVEGFIIDVGYSPRTPTESEPVILSFWLLESGSRRIPFTSALVSFQLEGESSVQTMEVPAENGDALFNHTFAESGTYQVGITYFDEGNAIVEHTFPFPISSSPSKIKEKLLWSIAILLSIILVLAIISKKMK